MSHEQPIDRAHPSCMLFLIDRSGSMSEPMGGGAGLRKANAVSDAINKFLANLVIKCSKGEGVRHYYDVGVIGYGSNPEGVPQVRSAFAGPLDGRDLVPVEEVAAKPARMESRMVRMPDGAGGYLEANKQFAVWFDPVAGGNTPMCEAFRVATQMLQGWVAQNQDSFPPIVINITDGESTDGDPTADAQALTALSTNDGNALLFTCHISKREGASITFPDTDASLPDEHARLLFNTCSLLPEKMRQAAVSDGFQIPANARGFAFNADLVDLIRFLDVGTRTNLK
jgi:hypothetical protein